MHKEKITAFVNSNEYVPMSKENMAVLLCVPSSDMEIFSSIINELIEEGVLVEGRKKRLFSSKSMGLIEGVFRASAKGFGFVSVPDSDDDIYIAEEESFGALNGDTVLVKIHKKNKNSDKKIRTN